MNLKSSTDGSLIWWEIEKDVLVSIKGVQLPVDINVQIEKPLFLTNTEKIKENREEKKLQKNMEELELIIVLMLEHPNFY